MNSEEDEFRRIEAEALRLWAAQTDDDDDTQVYAKPWQGLTDEEIWSVVSRIGTSDSNVNPLIVLSDARAIEAKLKEKNT